MVRKCLKQNEPTTTSEIIASLFLSDYLPGVNFSLRGCPRPRPPGLVFEGCPFGSFSVGPGIAPRSWLRRFAPTRNFVAGCGVVLDPGGILQDPKTRSLVVPGSVASLRPVPSSLVPGNNPTPIPIPSARRRRQRRSGIENQQVRTKSMLWGHINALILNQVWSGNVRDQKHGQ